jgi:hypothetical protein
MSSYAGKLARELRPRDVIHMRGPNGEDRNVRVLSIEPVDALAPEEALSDLDGQAAVRVTVDTGQGLRRRLLYLREDVVQVKVHT